MKRVYYTIEKSTLENKWILWRNTEGSHSFGCYRVYTGDTKKEVQRMKTIVEYRDNFTKHLNHVFNFVGLSKEVIKSDR